MHAKPGDRIIIKGHRLGEPDRDGEILEARGADGGPPYLVRWGDSGHTGLLFPGADACVQQFHRTSDRSSRGETMHTIETLKRSGVAVAPDATIKTAAGVMEHAGVGALAVVEYGRLIGIVTDRDLELRALARGCRSMRASTP